MRSVRYRKKHLLLNICLIASIIVILLIDMEPRFNMRKHGLNVTQSLEIYGDVTKSQTIKDILAAEDQLRFQSYEDAAVSSTIRDVNYWVRLPIYAANTANGDLLLEIAKPHLSEVDFYQVDQNQVVREVHTGRNRPFDSRDIHHRNFVFDIDPAYTTSTIYMRIHTDSYLQVPATLWTKDGFMAVADSEGIGYGAFYGALLIMIAYNGFLAIVLRDKTYFFYVLFVLNFGLLQAVWDGFSYQYLWQGASRWDLLANPLFIHTSALALLLFNGSFFGLSVQKGRLHGMYRKAEIVIAISICLLPFVSNRVGIYLGMFWAVMAIALSAFAVRFTDVSKRAKEIYIAAWGSIIGLNVLSILTGMHVLPFRMWQLFAPKVGVVCLVVFFSMALADRIQHAEYQRGVEAEKGNMLKRLHDLNLQIQSTRNLQHVFDFLMEEFREITPFENAFILMRLPDQERQVLLHRQNEREAVQQILSPKRYQRFLSLIHSSATGQVDPAFVETFSGDHKVRNAIAIPFENRGVQLGLLVLYTSRSVQMPDEMKRLLFDYANQIAITIDNINLLNEVLHASRYDGLTQVYNRKYFFDIATKVYQRAQVKQEQVAAIMLDIDHFKRINDVYGHSAGDIVLQRMVTHIEECLPQDGIIGRYGGEEFIILIPNTSQKEAVEIAEQIRVSIAESEFLINQTEREYIRVTVSLGVAFNHAHNQTLFALTEEADQALYRAKDAGRNAFYLLKGGAS